MAYSSIDQSVARGDFEIGLSGVEETPARRAALSVTVPYFEFREVLTVRQGDRDRYRSLAELRGRRVGTLGGTIAYEILLAARRDQGVVPVSYDDDVHPYEDLAQGRLDAVLLDNVLALRSTRRVAGLSIQPEAAATGRYVGVLSKENAALRDALDGKLRDMMRDGTLERIFRSWNLWSDDQAGLVRERVLAGEGASAPARARGRLRPIASAVGRLRTWSPPRPPPGSGGDDPPLVPRDGPRRDRRRGIASGRIYGGKLLRGVLTAYVEVTRGTPVLLQLFVIYYGLSWVGPAPRLRRRPPRPRPQLRRVRERDLPRRAGSRGERQLEAAGPSASPRDRSSASSAARWPSGSPCRR